MKHEKITSCLWGSLLAFCFSFGAVACMVTAFDMEISLASVAGILALAAVFCGICFSLPLGAAPLTLGAVALAVLWKKGILKAAAEAILNRLSRQYSRAYGWQIIRWSMRTAPEMEPDLLPAMCILGVVVALLTAWSVCRQKTALPGVLCSVLMLATCVVVTDTVPAAGWLYLCLVSMAILLVTSLVRRNAEEDANRLTAVVTVSSAVVLLIIFLLNPTQSYKGKDLAENMVEDLRQIPVLDMLFDRMGLKENTASVSAGNGVDLTTVGQRSSTGSKVMEIWISGTGTSTVYLRSSAFDMYDGETWTSSGDLMGDLNWPTDLQENKVIQITTNFAHQTLYTPYYVRSVSLNGTVIGVDNRNKLTQYSFSYSPMPGKQDFLSRYPDAYAGMDTREKYKLLQNIHMDSSVSRWAESMVQRIIGDVENPYHIAQAIGDYVRSSATYDLNTDRMPRWKNDFARWFLENSDTGYCVHFATAATVLLQAAGLPARYVTGYVVQAEGGQPTEVTADMAHAWAEYYLPGYGWTVLEATPADFTQQPTQTEPEQETDATDPEQTLPEYTGPDTTVPQMQQPEKEKQQFPWKLLWIALIPFAVIALAEGQYRLRRSLYGKTYARADQNQKAVLCWQQLVLLARLTGMTPDKDAYQLVQKAAFSQHLLTDEELRQLETGVENARRALQQKPPVLRLFCRLVYAI